MSPPGSLNLVAVGAPCRGPPVRRRMFSTAGRWPLPSGRQRRPSSRDNQRCRHTVPTVPWWAKLTPVENCCSLIRHLELGGRNRPGEVSTGARSEPGPRRGAAAWRLAQGALTHAPSVADAAAEMMGVTFPTSSEVQRSPCGCTRSGRAEVEPLAPAHSAKALGLQALEWALPTRSSQTAQPSGPGAWTFEPDREGLTRR